MSTPRKFIYIHVPKTGGNSIQTVLQRFSDDRKTLNDTQDGVDRFNITGPVTQNKHDTLAYYNAASVDLSAYFIFFSARHPFHRAVSAYFSPSNWVRRNTDGSLEILNPHWSFDDFISFIGRITPTVDYMKVDGRIYPTDDRIMVESIAKDFERIKRKLDITVADPLGHVNRTADRQGRIAAILQDRSLRRLVEERFSEDMDYLGY